MALVLTTGQTAVETPPAGASRLELYIQNRHPEISGGPRVLRTLDLVDLSVFGRTRKAHSDELRKALEQYLTHARRVGGAARSAARTRRGSAAVDTAKVREWAKGQGIEVKDRGRVPADIVEQYKTAAGA